MSPALLALLIQTASGIIQAILQMKANGALADADLEAAITATDANTQAIIRAALANLWFRIDTARAGSVSFTLQNVYATFLKALVAWREARGESVEAQLGVIWTVQNRAARPGWWGKDEVSVILCHEQYSSFNANDPNATKFPAANDSIFANLLVMAQAPGVDPTAGATHYYDKSLDANPPAWASEMNPTVVLGNLRFFHT